MPITKRNWLNAKSINLGFLYSCSIDGPLVCQMCFVCNWRSRLYFSIEEECSKLCILQCCHLSMTGLIRTKSTNHEPCHDSEKDGLALGIWFTKGDWQLCDPFMDRKPAAAGYTRFFANVLQTGKLIDVLFTGLNNCQL